MDVGALAIMFVWRPVKLATTFRDIGGMFYPVLSPPDKTKNSQLTERGRTPGVLTHVNSFVKGHFASADGGGWASCLVTTRIPLLPLSTFF